MNRQYPIKLNQNEIGVRIITKKYTNNQATNVSTQFYPWEGYRRRGRDEWIRHRSEKKEIRKKYTQIPSECQQATQNIAFESGTYLGIEPHRIE